MKPLHLQCRMRISLQLSSSRVASPYNGSRSMSVRCLCNRVSISSVACQDIRSVHQLGLHRALQRAASREVPLITISYSCESLTPRKARCLVVRCAWYSLSVLPKNQMRSQISWPIYSSSHPSRHTEFQASTRRHCHRRDPQDHQSSLSIFHIMKCQSTLIAIVMVATVHAQRAFRVSLPGLTLKVESSFRRDPVIKFHPDNMIEC